MTSDMRSTQCLRNRSSGASITRDGNRTLPCQKLQNFDYLDTLGNFLEHSNEDEVDAAEIFKFLIQKGVWRSSDKEAIWLDVGAGPATKVIAVLKMWRESREPNLPMVSLIEPSAGWRSEAVRRFRDAGLRELLVEVLPNRWEEFVTHMCPPRQFRLVTFLHSIYGLELSEKGLIDSLSHLPNLLDTHGWTCFAVESPRSDLYEMKRVLFPNLGFTLVDYVSLERTFRHFGWKYIVAGDFAQKFYLAYSPSTRKEAVANTEAMSFIVQTTPESYSRQLTTSEVMAIRNVVAKWLKRDDFGWYINVPDRLYWTRCDRQDADSA